MLLSHAFVRILRLSDNDIIAELPNDLVKRRIPTLLIQILMKLFQSQLPNGFWGETGSCKLTAYALLALKVMTGPWGSTLAQKVDSAIEKGTNYLEQHRSDWKQGAYTRVEKVKYRSPILSEAYCFAALKSPRGTIWDVKATGAWQSRPQEVEKLEAFFGSLSMFSSTPKWLLSASIWESQGFKQRLISEASTVFSTTDVGKHQYLPYVPITWVLTNNACRTGLSNELLWEMIFLSMLVYQVDELFEHDVMLGSQACIPAIQDLTGRLRQNNNCHRRLIGKLQNFF